MGTVQLEGGCRQVAQRRAEWGGGLGPKARDAPPRWQQGDEEGGAAVQNRIRDLANDRPER